MERPVNPHLQEFFESLLNKRHKCLDTFDDFYSDEDDVNNDGHYDDEVGDEGNLSSEEDKALESIKGFLERRGHNLDLSVYKFNEYERVIADEALLRLLVEHGADLSQLDQRLLWPHQRRHLAEYLTRGLRVNYRDPSESFPLNNSGWEGDVDEITIRQVLMAFGEIPREWDYRRQKMTLTSVNLHMFDILAALAKQDLASVSFFACFEKQLISLRGAENYFISLLRCGKWKKTKREVILLAARYGHLNLLRRILGGRDDDVFLAQNEQTSSNMEAANDYVSFALLNTDRLDVLQMLVNDFHADINTFDGDGNTVLHSLCRSPAAHALESLRWLFTSTDFALLDCEHSEDGTALDLACAQVHFPLLEQLLHHGYGYSLPLRKRELDRCALFGMPLIGYICARKYIPVSSVLLCVEELMRRGARLDTRSKVRGDTPIIMAARNKNWELTTALLDRDRTLLLQENKYGESCATFMAAESEKDVDANMLLKRIIFLRQGLEESEEDSD